VTAENTQATFQINPITDLPGADALSTFKLQCPERKVAFVTLDGGRN
jgi:hypothetical protein